MYVDAIYDRRNNYISVVERVNGERILKREKFENVLYYRHASGSTRTIFGDPVRKFASTNGKLFGRKKKQLLAEGKEIYESDIREVFRHLATHYPDGHAPDLNICFFDIETDFHPDKGFSPPEDPFNAVTAISLFATHLGRLVTLAMPPRGLDIDEATEMVEPKYDDDGNLVGGFEDTFLFEQEADLLETFLILIEDADILTGWNSEGFDIPYLINRIRRVIDAEALRRFCLWDMMPREKEQMKFGKAFITYELVGRVHLDYLVLYQKHNTQQRHSYSLDAIGEIEVNERKVPYDGTLDDLYNKEFYKFIEYSRQDVALLVKIDEKCKFISLANQIAHANGVLLQTTVGSVALVEQAIINEMNAMGFVVPDRPEKVEREEGEERTPVVGAYVAQPNKGIHKEIAAVDINSLYPSAIRALNMSPETLWGQIRTDSTMSLVEKRAAVSKELAWEGLFSVLEVMHMHADERHEVDLGCGTPYNMVTVDPETPLIVDTVDGKTMHCSARELKEHIWANQLCISANGTIFVTDRDGIIPQLLAKWYRERKDMQGREKAFDELTDGLEIDDELALQLTDLMA